MKTIELIKNLVSIPSAFPNEKALGKYLFSYLKDLGFKVQKVQTEKDRFNIVAVFGKAKKYLGFYGHMDTVPPASNQKNPYTFSISDTIATGLGVEDMKGGIAAMLQAGEYAVKNNFPIKIIFGVDEENISQGAYDLLESGLLDDIGFLIVGESGQVKDYNQAFSVCYGRKGRILFEAEIIGKKAHAAESEKAINAVEHALAFVQLLKKMKFMKHKNLDRTRIVIHEVHSETDSFSVPDKAYLSFSLLTTPNIDSQSFLKYLIGKAKRAKITCSINPVKRKTPYGESYEVDKKSIFLKTIEEKILLRYGISPIYASSVADENVFAHKLKIPVISIGPVGGGGHTVEEWLDLKSLTIVEKVYKDLINYYNSA